MIQANELRIGNLFSKFNDRTGIWQLNPIGVKDIECAVNTPNIFNALYDAIKITPYYLEKAGFTQHHDDCFNDFMFIKGIFGDAPFNWGVYPNDGTSGVYITGKKGLRYLHQLQNLVYAITGEELEINLTPTLPPGSIG